MSNSDHYEAAIQGVASAMDKEAIAIAQVHATLALVDAIREAANPTVELGARTFSEALLESQVQAMRAKHAGSWRGDAS